MLCEAYCFNKSIQQKENAEFLHMKRKAFSGSKQIFYTASSERYKPVVVIWLIFYYNPYC